MHPCRVCKKTDDQKPMCFRGEEWCCESHRRIVMRDTEELAHTRRKH